MITNRSPSVSRNTFHSLFRGPTIRSSRSWIVSQYVGFRREEIHVRRVTLIDAYAPRIELLFLQRKYKAVFMKTQDGDQLCTASCFIHNSF